MGPKRIAMLLSVWILSRVLAASAAQAQGMDFSKVEIKATKVAGSVYVLEGAGGNIGVSVGSDGILIVDDQFAPLADKIKAALKSLGTGKLKFILNTHWHMDHTGGNKAFGPEAPIVAHTNVRKRLASGGKVAGMETPAAPKEALPVITFDDSLSIHFNGEEIKAVHVPPAHTDGDTVVHFTNSNVIHMGDLFFSGRFPFVDLGSGGDVEGLLEDVRAILAKLPAGVKIIPGHGPVSDAEGLRTYERMLTESIDFVRSRMSLKKTLEQIQAEGLPEKWKGWGWEFVSQDRWLQIVHASLLGAMRTRED